jgi:hypothetical protein
VSRKRQSCPVCVRCLAAALLIPLLSLAAVGQDTFDPAFDPPPMGVGTPTGGVRWNGAIGMAIIDGKPYQQFSLRPDIPLGKFGIGLDLTIYFDENGNIRKEDWDEPLDFVEKIYYARYGLPGDPFYVRVGALDAVTLGYGIIMKHYSNAIEYPAVKRLGLYTEGEYKRIGWQAMLNNFREIGEPGLLGCRLSYRTGLAGLTFGASAAYDGNQYAGLHDSDHDGVPDAVDMFKGVNDFTRRDQILALLTHDQIQQLIDWGLLPNIYLPIISYKSKRDGIGIVGADVGLPIWRKRPISIWLYAQAAKILDYGWGTAFPGVTFGIGPLKLGYEFRHYDKQFLGEYFNFVYEIERVRFVGDSIFVPKEARLKNLSRANGHYGDMTLYIGTFAYLNAWYLDMHGANYPAAKTIYGEAGLTPAFVPKVRKVSGYFMQPNVRRLFQGTSDGTIYGAKVYLGLGSNVTLVYDYRTTYWGGEPQRTVRIEAMMTF